LKDSLGGNSKTTILLTGSPYSKESVDTVATLDFGLDASKIKTRAKINRKLCRKELEKQF